MEYYQRRPYRQPRSNKTVILWVLVLIIIILFLIFLLYRKVNKTQSEPESSSSPTPAATMKKEIPLPSWVDVQLIKLDGKSRNGLKLEGVKDIVVHYVANPGTSAQQNRNYFNNADSEVSAHFVIGLNGEVIQCVPLDEKSSASNHRNIDTISIEVCHPDESGRFNDATYQTLVKLTAWLCYTYDLDSSHVIRHYDITGKDCPRYYVKNEDKWEQFKTDVMQCGEYR